MSFGIVDREYGAWLHSQLSVLLPGELVIDLGCGTGADAAYLNDLGMRVVGMDLSLKRVLQAARRVPDAHFLVGDLAAGLPLKSGIADVATASLSLHYFDRDTTETILEDISRILRNDGFLLCRVNVAGEAIAGWGSGVEHQPDFFEVEPGRFKRFFSAESLTEALSTHFRIERMELERTRMMDGFEKQTLVAKARRSG